MHYQAYAVMSPTNTITSQLTTFDAGLKLCDAAPTDIAGSQFYQFEWDIDSTFSTEIDFLFLTIDSFTKSIVLVYVPPKC